MATAQKLACRITEIVEHGEHVYSLVLNPQNSQVPRFKAGQFLHLALDNYDPSGFWPESRVFSIASSPRDLNEVKITYSVRGRFTQRMENELTAGREVWVKMPYGDFLVEGGKNTVLFAGGTGITAFSAYLAGLADNPGEGAGAVAVFYGARDESLLVYRPLVEECREKLDAFKAVYFLENCPRQCQDSEIVGKISAGAAWHHIRQPLDAAYYVSGPPQMLQAVSTELRDRGVAAANIRIDAWE
jgi:ferredoxin-NADP reductase